MIQAVLAPLRRVNRRLKLAAQRRRLQALADGRSARLVIGTSGMDVTGWIGTDREVLDLLNADTWTSYFPPDRLDAILAEHVWEHLTEAHTAAAICYRFLKPGGYLRVAVPDGFHPDPDYLAAVAPGGSGWGSDDHKVLYNYRTFSKVFTDSGFEVQLLEYFDDRHQFVYREWDPADGMIRRSSRYDVRNAQRPLAYTSIVLDARKPVHRP